MEIKLSNLSFSASAVDAIRNHFLRAFRECEEWLLQKMEDEIVRTNYGNGPGKPAWREMLQKRMTIVDEIVTNSFFEGKVGLDADMIYSDFVKAMLIAYGAGSAAGGDAIHAGPTGRMVWDDNLDGQKPSSAQGWWDLPAAFNQPGNDWVNNAVRNSKVECCRILNQALHDLKLDSLIASSMSSG